MKEIVEALPEQRAAHRSKAQVLLGMPEGEDRSELLRCLTDAAMTEEIGVASTFVEMESRAARDLPAIIVLSEKIVRADMSLAEATHRLTVFAPVIVIASSERQSDVVGLVVSGEVDFVTIETEFASVATALIERRLKWPQSYSCEFRSARSADAPPDFAEVLRHEINNPLTGILGNAELLLSQLRDELPPLSVQRLETVVDLAVRLREKVRRLAEPKTTCSSGTRSA